jgi:hypothetical protein
VWIFSTGFGFCGCGMLWTNTWEVFVRQRVYTTYTFVYKLRMNRKKLFGGYVWSQDGKFFHGGGL